MTVNGINLPDGCEIGVFTPTENELTHTITHSLGEIPKFAVCLCVPNKAWSDIMGTAILLEDLMSDPQTGTFDTSLTTSRKRNEVVSNNLTDNTVATTTTYTTYPADMTSSTVTFTTGRYYSGKFASGEKYIYILVK